MHHKQIVRIFERVCAGTECMTDCMETLIRNAHSSDGDSFGCVVSVVNLFMEQCKNASDIYTKNCTKVYKYITVYCKNDSKVTVN